mmetsp:Transcript_25174/g.72540  ORF Transcript_25174/g.72540 Transcript_25174/m.72540 type:complete len:812 (+) Transcript_25174:196-2631(+)
MVAVWKLHEPQQRHARAVNDPEHCAGPRQQALCHLPFALRIVLVPHVEHVDEFQGVPEPHGRDLRILIEEVHHVILLVPLVRFLRLEELSHAEPLLGGPIYPHRWRGLDGQAHAIQVDRIQLHGSHRTGDGHPVDEATLGRDGLRAYADHGLGNNDVHTIDLSRALDAFGYAHIRRQVRSVDFELAAHSALDGPTEVQATAEVHPTVFAEALLQTRMPSICSKHRRSVYRTQDPRECEHRHVSQLRRLVRRHVPRPPPDHQEEIAIVLASVAMELVDHAVDNLGDLVHESHDTGLQNLRGSAEVADAGRADDAVDPGALNHGVHASAVDSFHVVLDDLSAGLSETKREKRTKLDDGLFKDDGLQQVRRRGLGVTEDEVPDHPHQRFFLLDLRLALLGAIHLLDLEFIVSKLHCGKRLVPDGLHLGDHVLDWVQHQPVRVIREHQRGNAQGDTNVYDDHQREDCVPKHEGTSVEIECDVPGLESCLVHQQRSSILPALRAPQIFGTPDGVVHIPIGVLLADDGYAYAVKSTAFNNVALIAERLAEQRLDPWRHAAEVEYPLGAVGGLHSGNLGCPSRRRGRPHPGELRIGTHLRFIPSDDAEPEQLGLIHIGAELPSWTLAGVARVPVVVIHILQKSALVLEPHSLVIGELDEFRIGLIDDIRSIVRGSLELPRSVDVQELVEEQHREHQNDHTPRRELRKFLADPAFPMQLVHAQVNIHVVPIVLVIARIHRPGSATFFRLVGLVNRLVQFYDTDKADHPHEPSRASSYFRGSGAADVREVLLVAGDEILDARKVKDEGDRRYDVQNHEEA